MVDFYAELHLNQQDSIAELNQTLTQLESTWKRREITNPEKATTMLALIIQARRAFASESSRREYDRELAKSKEKPVERDPNAEREQQFKKWFDDARSYYDGKQYDLAKTAVEKALSYYDQASDNDAFLRLVAHVYRDNQNYSAALDYINKAIIISPEDAWHYIDKAFILHQQSISERTFNNHTKAQVLQVACNILNQATTLAHRRNDKNAESVAYGYLAYYHYYVPAPDRDKAEEYANKSIALGDFLGDASKVLKDIKQKRQQEAKAAEEQRRQQEQRAQAEQERKERKAREENERKRRTQRRSLFQLLNNICGIGFVAWLLLSVYYWFMGHEPVGAIPGYVLGGGWCFFRGVLENEFLEQGSGVAVFGGLYFLLEWIAGPTSWEIAKENILILIVVIVVSGWIGKAVWNCDTKGA